MKRILFLFLIVLSGNLIFAQDIIVKGIGDEIKTKIIETTDQTIKYKEYDFQDGPIRNISISQVYMVIYENGRTEMFNSPEDQAQIEVQTPPEETKNEDLPSGYKGTYFMLGAGVGRSYGGLGIRAQMRVGGNQGFGLHAGVGYYANAPVLATAGIKFFPWRDLYFNAQYGLVGVETTHGGSYYYDYNHDVLWGSSFLTGVDLTWGSVVGLGFNAAIGATHYSNNTSYDSWVMAVDLGFLVRF